MERGNCRERKTREDREGDISRETEKLRDRERGRGDKGEQDRQGERERCRQKKGRENICWAVGVG